MSHSIGSILRKWRKQRRYSQLQLALDLGISSKHISFLETGRSIPSRKMILKIGTFLYLSKREINRGLYLAGYAPVYAEFPTGHKNLEPVLSAIDQMILNHMPYPAIVLNQDWDVVTVNDSAKKLLFEVGYSEHQNLVEAIISDDPETSKIINWQESVSVLLVRLRNEINMLGGSDRLEELEEKLTSHLPGDDEITDIDENKAVLSTKFQLADCVLSFFSVIAHLGAVQDVTVSEYKVELMFPSDDETREFYKI
ncbi:MAG TPA: helix-turn-helix domain-containing protein [Gammaproteobacteria bacterium]|nr:helix-turn-helix domain-containing protein [Gammaproteobacteria bacterium]